MIAHSNQTAIVSKKESGFLSVEIVEGFSVDMELVEMETVMCNQITLDIDPPNVKKKLHHALKILSRYPIGSPFIYGYPYGGTIQVNSSPSGHGYHVISWSKRGVPPKQLKELRILCGDDRMRVRLDSKSGRMTQVLFCHKKREEVFI